MFSLSSVLSVSLDSHNAGWNHVLSLPELGAQAPREGADRVAQLLMFHCLTKSATKRAGFGQVLHSSCVGSWSTVSASGITHRQSWEASFLTQLHSSILGGRRADINPRLINFTIYLNEDEFMLSTSHAARQKYCSELIGEHFHLGSFFCPK